MQQFSEGIVKVPRFSENNGFSTSKKRSTLMSKIGSKDTKPEQKLRKFLWGIGLRYRKNYKKLPGSPDIVLPKFKLIIFIDGEFWHGYNWLEKRDKIESNREYWIPKIERNIQRDNSNNEKLSKAGWKIIRFWGHELEKEFGWCILRIIENIEI